MADRNDIKAVNLKDLDPATSTVGMVTFGVDNNNIPYQIPYTLMKGDKGDRGDKGEQGVPGNTAQQQVIYNVSQTTGNYAYADKQTARNAVPADKRALGQIISYQLATGDWIAEQYIGSDVSGWATATNWDSLTAEYSRLFSQKGYIHKTSGEFIADDSFRSTGFLKIAENPVTVNTSVSGSASNVFYYRKDFSKISAVVNSGIDIIVSIANAPQGAYYYRVTGGVINNYLTGFDYASLGELYNKRNVGDNSELFSEKGYLHSLTGEFISDSNHLSTPFIAIEDAVTVNTFIRDSLTSVANIVYYKDDLSFHSSKKANGDVNIVPSELSVSIKYFRACGNSLFPLGISYNMASLVKEDNVFRKKIKAVEDFTNLFTYTGYLNSKGEFVSGEGYLTTSFLPIPRNEVELNAVVGGFAYKLCYFDNRFNPVGGAIKDDKITIDESTLDKQIVYFRACTSVSALNSDTLRGYILNDLISYPETDYSFDNNMLSQQFNEFITPSEGNYGSYGTQYSIKNKSTNGIVHLAFRFRINEDVNTSTGTDAPFVEFLSDTDDLTFYLHKQATSVMNGGEDSSMEVVTRSPIPYFNSAFGVKSSLDNTKLNVLYPSRSLKYYTEDTIADSQKPLCGSDLFSIKIDAVDNSGNIRKDTLSADVQAILSRWKDAYIEVTDRAVNVVNEVEGLSYNYPHASYGNIQLLFTKMCADLDGKIVGNAKITLQSIGASMYDIDIYPKNILRCKLYLATDYQRRHKGTKYVDAFPAYISNSISRDWHTFELVTLTGKDELVFCIDGQYQNTGWSRPDYIISGVKSFFKSCKEIKIGTGLNLLIRDLVYEYNQYSDVYANREPGASNSCYFASKLHPFVWNFFGHDTYKVNYTGGVIDDYSKFTDNGGKIPTDLISSVDGYLGDDSLHQDRAHITQPSFQIESMLRMLKEADFMPITHRQWIEGIMTGKFPHYKCYVVGFDDFPTYIYDRKELKNIFSRYGCKPYFALELGYYVDNNTPTSSYNAEDFIDECKDTNEHRLMLQKRLLSLQNDNWGIELHGAKNGFEFRGSTYYEILATYNEAVKIAEYLGIEVSSWCIAGNLYTPNAIKFLEHSGIQVATSTTTSPTAQAFHRCYQPRRGFFATYQQLTWTAIKDF